jgi:pilus assembly protein Flp/PilA
VKRSVLNRRPGHLRGQGLTEYILIVSLIAIASLAVVTLFGDNVRRLFGAAATSLSGEKSVQPSFEKSKAEFEEKNLGNFSRENDYK